MSDTTSVKQGFAVGTSIGAAVILVTVGIVQFFQGLAAVAENEVFVVGIDYVYQFDLTTWGWIHLVLGALVALVGLALFTGATWATGVGRRDLRDLDHRELLVAAVLPLVVDSHHRAEHRRDLGGIYMEAHPDDERHGARIVNADSICLS